MGNKVVQQHEWPEKGVVVRLITFRSKPLFGLFSDKIGAKVQVLPHTDGDKKTRKLVVKTLMPFGKKKKARRRLAAHIGTPRGEVRVTIIGPADATPGNEFRSTIPATAINGRFQFEVSESWAGIPFIGGDLRVRADGSGQLFKPARVEVSLSNYALGRDRLPTPVVTVLPV